MPIDDTAYQKETEVFDTSEQVISIVSSEPQSVQANPIQLIQVKPEPSTPNPDQAGTSTVGPPNVNQPQANQSANQTEVRWKGVRLQAIFLEDSEKKIFAQDRQSYTDLSIST
ncbi:hypothetical protein L6452_17442 [Arctium lappa]|uniref:Uncharacterized protein n=1 Tax=Arctium lappa TaxID=4217 RepID=A0ACB9C3L7_ARCLA|nr:hypothetical protein L6452_17442 [Arctium lappa]